MASSSSSQVQDTPEAFILRLKNASSKPDYDAFKREIFASDSELQEHAKNNWGIYFDWNNGKPTEKIEKQLIEMKADMAKIIEIEAANFFSYDAKTLEKVEFSEIKIDSSAAAVGQIFFMQFRPNGLSVAQISANLTDPLSGKKGTIRLPVCRLSGGQWKVWSAIGMVTNE